MSKIVNSSIDCCNGVATKLWGIHSKIKSEYPQVPDFDSFNIYSITKLKLIEQQSSMEESKSNSAQAEGVAERGVDSSQSITSQIDKLKSDFERYSELHSHDQDSAALMQMQGVINALYESMHHQ